MRWIDILATPARLFRPRPAAKPSLLDAAEILASAHGAASPAALAAGLLSRYAALSDQNKKGFLSGLAARFGPDRARLDAAVERYRLAGDAGAIAALHAASEPKAQQLIRRLNLAAGGTAALVAMRADALRFAASIADFERMDADFVHLFTSWFNAGFLELRPIAWTSPGNVLRKVMDYEAVHPIETWEDLRRRVEPEDRRCYGFFHPQMPDEPLIFVEVALTVSVPQTIAELLTGKRSTLPPAAATTAVFYSISNCQEGLKGVPFGNDLIKRTVESLSRELPGLNTFVTLSPVPGFAAWIGQARKAQNGPLSAAEKQMLTQLDRPDWHAGLKTQAPLCDTLRMLTARYLIEAKPGDAVARFHLGNGARLENVHVLADASAKGLKTGLGMMVNYRYDLSEIERNHQAFRARGEVPASAAMRRLARPGKGLLRGRGGREAGTTSA